MPSVQPDRCVIGMPYVSTHEDKGVTLHDLPAPAAPGLKGQRKIFAFRQPIGVIKPHVDPLSAGSIKFLAEMRLTRAAPNRLITQHLLGVDSHVGGRDKKPLALANECPITPR